MINAGIQEYQQIILGLSAKRRRALLRNNIHRNELESQFSGLSLQLTPLSLLCPMLLVMEYGAVIFLLGGNHVVDDASEFVGNSSDGFRSAEASLQPPKIVTQVSLAPVQCLSCYS